MNDDLEALSVERRTGHEKFHLAKQLLDFDLLGFWQWSSSDLVGNALRGKLAEYIVAYDLGVHTGTRTEWDAYDLKTPEGIKIEVKSAAYLQSWKQNRLSAICFDIRQTYGWDAATNTSSTERKRQADIYIFCLLHHQNKSTLDPLDLSQWEFYVLLAQVLDEKLPNQRSLTFARLLRLNPVKVGFGKIKEVVYRLCQVG
jgi:hypothetical protein